MEYVIVKWLHVVSSTFLFGTGIGSAFYLLMASLRRDAATVPFVARHVVIADGLFTATSIVLQPLTGFYLVHLAGMSLSRPWLAWSIALYAIAALCWLPVVSLQMRLRNLEGDAAAQRGGLPRLYWTYFRAWVTLGLPACLALLAVFYLMVAKPAP